jgi:hypothetical protein
MANYGLLAGVLVLMLAVIIGSVQSEAINYWLQRRFPSFRYDGQGWLLTGLSLLAAFMLGLLTMYAILEVF